MTNTATRRARKAPVRSGACAEDALWERYRKTRSRRLRNQLVERYMPLVAELAVQMRRRLPRHVDGEDLYSAGVFGLLRAIEHFDPSRGFRFATYGKRRVSGAMLDELRRQDWIPREARARVERVDRTATELREKFAREPSDRELARVLGLTLTALHRTAHDREAAKLVLRLDAARPPRHVEQPGYDDPEPYELIDAVPEPSDVAQRRDLLRLVERHLSARERAIVRGYYHDSQSMKRIGSQLRLTESRVCQMHNQMLSRLKERLHQEALT